MSTCEAIIIVRRAEMEDLPICAEWMLALQDQTHWRQYAPLPLVERTIWLASRGCLFVAETDDYQMVGMIGGTVRTHELFPDVPYVMEEPFYVEHAYRSREAGKQLLAALKEWALAQGAKALALGRPSATGEVLRWHPLGGSHG